MNSNPELSGIRPDARVRIAGIYLDGQTGTVVGRSEQHSGQAWIVRMDRPQGVGIPTDANVPAPVYVFDAFALTVVRTDSPASAYTVAPIGPTACGCDARADYCPNCGGA